MTVEKPVPARRPFKRGGEVASGVGNKTITRQGGLIGPIRHEQLFKAARAENDQHGHL